MFRLEEDTLFVQLPEGKTPVSLIQCYIRKLCFGSMILLTAAVICGMYQSFRCKMRIIKQSLKIYNMRAKNIISKPVFQHVITVKFTEILFVESAEQIKNAKRLLQLRRAFAV